MSYEFALRGKSSILLKPGAAGKVQLALSFGREIEKTYVHRSYDDLKTSGLKASDAVNPSFCGLEQLLALLDPSQD
jgi:hypothetical protein